MSKETNGNGVGDGDKVPILAAKEPHLATRLNTLANHFIGRFNREPAFFVRVPGRVNLIGEHIDYCGYAVCPMAIRQDVLVAVSSTTDEVIRLTNYDSKYPDFECDFDHARTGSFGTPAWHNYFLCGLKGALEEISDSDRPLGMLAAVWGNIPPSSGLSSSSALVSSAALSALHLNQCCLSKKDMGTLCAQAERYIGTQGGGMDQAIAFLGKAGCAKLIEFDPLRASDVTLPENAVFVIAHSLARHNKASTSDYNLRVTECRLAAQIIAKKSGLKWEGMKKLVDVQTQLDKTLVEMVDVVTETLHEDAYTTDEICNVLGTTLDYLRQVSFTTAFVATQRFELQPRALHVFQEAERVLAFQRINQEEGLGEDDRLRKLGNLMTESHISLKNQYECSHRELDRLVDDALTSGALGARLTGAGWGGCAVALTTTEKVSEFLDTLKRKFYAGRGVEASELDALLFPTEPNQGAAIYVP